MWDKDWALKWENWRELQWKKWLSWCSVCLSAQSTDLSTQTLRFARGTRWDFSCLPSGETSEGRARLWAPRHQTMHPNIISIQSPNLIPLFPRHAPIFEMKGDKKKQVTPPPTASYPSSSTPSSSTKKIGIKVGALVERGTLQLLFNPTPPFMWTLYTDRVFSLYRDGQL